MEKTTFDSSTLAICQDFVNGIVRFTNDMSMNIVNSHPTRNCKSDRSNTLPAAMNNAKSAMEITKLDRMI